MKIKALNDKINQLKDTDKIKIQKNDEFYKVIDVKNNIFKIEKGDFYIEAYKFKDALKKINPNLDIVFTENKIALKLTQLNKIDTADANFIIKLK